ncbi:hypothetical protein [Treponema endosymbiont of Eucomonympha sp.]|uniref:hypothetical protein n=1 Tax=Treponema endosymbiont of Eucomonympha sp. TaxID=1580831 RepID=UPI0007848621|nr:hypothetical protein [Treponema endosymbiont of Eucomonympha sp.]
MSGKDYIPGKDSDFLEWAKTLVAYAAANADRLGLSAELTGELERLLIHFEAAYARAEDPNRGAADVLAKKEARAALETKARSVVRAHLAYGDTVTDDDRALMGLPLHDKTRTPVPAPHTYPTFEINTGVLRQLTLRFRDHDSSGWAKPEGAHGAEIRWDILPVPTVNPDALTHSAFSTRSPHTLVFSGDERGKTAYICLRWENTTGEKGPWGEISSAIVP